MADTVTEEVQETTEEPKTQVVTKTETKAAESAEEKVFPESYVKSIRSENAETRNKLRDAEAKLKRLEPEKLTETERTSAERDEFKEKAERLEKQIADQALSLLRAKSAAKYKLPEHWIGRLEGTTEEE